MFLDIQLYLFNNTIYIHIFMMSVLLHFPTFIFLLIALQLS